MHKKLIMFALVSALAAGQNVMASEVSVQVDPIIETDSSVSNRGTDASNETPEKNEMDEFQRKVAEYSDVEADYKHVSDTCFVSIQSFHDDYSVWKLTHIIVKDPSQIKGALSYDDLGGTRELPTSVAARKDAVLLVNGSYFSYDTGEPACDDVLVKGGEVVRAGSSNGHSLAIKSDGTMYTPDAGTSGEQLVADGVVETFSTADPVLIKDGEACEDGVTKKCYPRNGIGMVEPGEYYIITASDGSYNNGMSFKFMRDQFLELGCTYARSLDGGGSASLVFEGNLINHPAAGSERPVVDFLYFTD